MLSAIFTFLSGGAIRLLPELIGLWNKKEDNDHERQMMDKQIQLEQLHDAAKIAQQTQQFDADKVIAMLGAQKDALSDQMKSLGNAFQLSGVKWIDGWNAFIRTGVDILSALVRPATTYFFLGMFGIYKAALLAQALASHDAWAAILLVYTPNDADTLTGIIGFWFMGRCFDSPKPK